MKKMIFVSVLFAGFAAQAAQVTKFNCTVPNKSTPTVSLDIAVSDNESVDFVTFKLNDKTTSDLFMQLDKGAFQKQVDNGSVGMLVLEENYSQGADGVIRNAGFLALGLDNGTWGGFMTIKSNVYPLSCTRP